MKKKSILVLTFIIFVGLSTVLKASPPPHTSPFLLELHSKPKIQHSTFLLPLVSSSIFIDNIGKIPITDFTIQIQKKCTTTVSGVWTRDDTAPDDPARNGCLQPYSNTCYQVIGNCSSDDPTESAYLPTLHSGDILDCGYWNSSGNFINESLEVLTITNMGNYPGYSQDKLNIISGIYIFTIKYQSTGDVYEVRMRKI